MLIACTKRAKMAARSGRLRPEWSRSECFLPGAKLYEYRHAIGQIAPDVTDIVRKRSSTREVPRIPTRDRANRARRGGPPRREPRHRKYAKTDWSRPPRRWSREASAHHGHASPARAPDALATLRFSVRQRARSEGSTPCTRVRNRRVCRAAARRACRAMRAFAPASPRTAVRSRRRTRCHRRTRHPSRHTQYARKCVPVYREPTTPARSPAA
jgi:hypothetical protein